MDLSMPSVPSTSTSTPAPSTAILNLTADTAGTMPRKRYYRQRAHANPLSIHNLSYPESPAQMDWSKHYPTFFNSPSSTDPSNPSNSSTDGSNIGVGSSSIKGKKVEFADIGCGFGGLVVNVAPLFPETLMLGLELRVQVTQYVSDKLAALRVNPAGIDPEDEVEDISDDEKEKEKKEEKPLSKNQLKKLNSLARKTLLASTSNTTVVEQGEKEDGPSSSKRIKLDPTTSSSSSLIPTKPAVVVATNEITPEGTELKTRILPPLGYSYENASVLRCNAMKFLSNFFEKGQLSKIFFLFPDPHFKARKHKARIISPTLLAEYAYILKPGGLLYTITDVPSLHTWMISHLSPFPLFKRLSEEEINNLGRESNEAVEGYEEGGSEEGARREEEVMRAVKRRTEEGRKVERNGKGKEWSVWRRVEEVEEEE